MVTHESLYATIQRLKFQGHKNIQLVLTKETIESLVGAEVSFENIQPNQEIQLYDMRFGGTRVYLGVQDKIQVIECEVWL